MDREGTSLRFEPMLNGGRSMPYGAEECLVSDARAGLTPAQQVERKLAALLPNSPLSVSQLQGMRTNRSLS